MEAGGDELKSQLERHWHPQFGTIGEDLSNDPGRDFDGNVIDDDEFAFSTSAVLAVNYAALSGQAYDDLDKRVWSSLWKQQEYFSRTSRSMRTNSWDPASVAGLTTATTAETPFSS